ncbi:hypothetical protein C8Q79DRAFT_897410 [Trametes meyenii]|nr:hypothetical protein C8Q79DRAFT_897410 [Trametes meyenii]
MVDLRARKSSAFPSNDAPLSIRFAYVEQNGELAARATETDPVSYIPAQSLAGTLGAVSSTTDTPFFPTPSGYCDGCEIENDKSLDYTKNAVEGALIVVAVALIISLTFWRTMRLRRRNLPLREFFRTHPNRSSTNLVSRPPTVPRTTGLPPTQAPSASVIYDSLTSPVPLVHRGETLRYGRRHGRGRRTYATDIGAGGRRGTVAHPDDPNEFLPEYDDKDILPRYQDLEAGDRRGAPSGEDEGRMAVIAAMLGRSPNRDGGTSDTDPLVTAMELGGMSDDGHAYPPTSSVGSHDAHDGHGTLHHA